MAAPSSVYQTYKTRRRKAGTPDVDVDLYIAKFLQNTTPPSGDDWGDGYFNSTDTEAQKIAKIKDIFKIDGWNQADYAEPKTGTITISGTSVTGSGTAFTTDFVVGQKLGALQLIDDELKCVETYTITAITSATAMSVVAGTNRSGISYALYRQGFIGYCYSRTSGNGLYHNWDNNTSPFVARGSGVRVPTSAQASAELLNDGGLNRKPDPLIVEGDAAQVWWANLYSIKFNVRSAFYDYTSKIGFEYKVNSGSWTLGAFTNVNQVAKNKTTYEFRKNDSLGTQGQTLYLRAFAENAEDKKYSQEYSSAMGEKVYQLLALKVTNINDTTGTSTEIYMNETDFNNITNLTTSSQSLGIEGFTSDLMTTEIADGYYKGLDPNNPNRVYTYAGEFTKYDNATSTDSEGLPIGMPRLYKSFVTNVVSDTFAIGQVTDSSSYPTVVQVTIGQTSVSANVQITGMETGQGLGSGRNADIYLRRTNANTPSVNEDIFVKTIYIEPMLQFDDTFVAVLSSATIDYDKFTFIEL